MKLSPESHRLTGVNSSLWTSLSDEILNDPLESQPSNSNLDVSDSAPEATVSSLIFDLRLGDMSLTHLHPPAAQIFSLWQTFLDHVNPLVKIIHAPTLQRRILEASVAVEQVSRPLEALMFAIYSCAVTSLSHEECVELAGESRDTLMAVYHRAAEQALIRAGFLKTLDIVVLQAAVLFAVSHLFHGLRMPELAYRLACRGLSHPSLFHYSNAVRFLVSSLHIYIKDSTLCRPGTLKC